MLIHSGTIITPTEEKGADIFIEDGIIKAEDGGSQETIMIDATGLLVFPGFIDCHVHFRDPGLTDKADMKTESKAARFAGVTTVWEMPTTIPATVSITALKDKIKKSEQITDCDMRFFFGATRAEHLSELKILWTDSKYSTLKEKCCGLKVFFDHSTGDQGAGKEVIKEAFKLCNELKIPLVAHCEAPEINNAAADSVEGDDISLHSEMRPPEAEEKSIKDAIGLVREYGTAFHVAHLSTAKGLDLIRQAKKDGLPITCEVTPHHLFLSTDQYKYSGTLVKMNPPLRSESDRHALWEGIKDGTVDCISTDHAPHTLEEKEVTPTLSAPSGMPGVETMIPLLLTAAHEEAISYADILRCCFTSPNSIFNLGKEEIAEGNMADIVIIDPNEKWTLKKEDLLTKCGWSPFTETKMTGRVKHVLLARDSVAL